MTEQREQREVRYVHDMRDKTMKRSMSLLMSMNS